MSLVAQVLVAVFWLLFMFGLLSVFAVSLLSVLRRVASPEVNARVRSSLRWTGWTR